MAKPSSGGEQLRLLGGELLLGEHALVPQLAELLQLRDRIGGGRGRLRRRFVVSTLLCLLLRPARLLAAVDSVADGGGGSRYDSRAGNPSNQSWHYLLLSESGLRGRCPGFLRRLQRSENGLHRDAATGYELAAGLPDRRRERRRPPVFEHEQRCRGARLER